MVLFPLPLVQGIERTGFNNREIVLALALFLSSLFLTCAIAKDLTIPDPKLTPGQTRELSKQEICSTKWGLDRRHVSWAKKQQVYHLYGLSGSHDPACVTDQHGRTCEIDHFYPRSLAGADSIQNLWPQPYGTKPWNASRKDRLEVRVSREYCAGRLTLKQAQDMMAPDYRPAYIRYFGKP